MEPLEKYNLPHIEEIQELPFKMNYDRFGVQYFLPVAEGIKNGTVEAKEEFEAQVFATFLEQYAGQLVYETPGGEKTNPVLTEQEEAALDALDPESDEAGMIWERAQIAQIDADLGLDRVIEHLKEQKSFRGIDENNLAGSIKRYSGNTKFHLGTDFRSGVNIVGEFFGDTYRLKIDAVGAYNNPEKNIAKFNAILPEQFMGGTKLPTLTSRSFEQNNLDALSPGRYQMVVGSIIRASGVQEGMNYGYPQMDRGDWQWFVDNYASIKQQNPVIETNLLNPEGVQTTRLDGTVVLSTRVVEFQGVQINLQKVLTFRCSIAPDDLNEDGPFFKFALDPETGKPIVVLSDETRDAINKRTVRMWTDTFVTPVVNS